MKTLPSLVSLIAAACLHAATADVPRTELTAPSGAWRRVILTADSLGSAGKAITIAIQFRDDKPSIACSIHPRVEWLWTDGLTLIRNRLSGRICGATATTDGKLIGFDAQLSAALAEAHVAGSLKGEIWALDSLPPQGAPPHGIRPAFARPANAKPLPFDSPVTGSIQDADSLRKIHALAQRLDWPAWSGPHGNFTAPRGDAPLVRDLADSRLAWVSEAEIRGGRGGEKEGRGTPYGGYSSPVVGGGRVFLSQFEGSGDRLSSERPDQTSDHRIDGDDLVWCFDAATGQLLWKQRIVGASLNGPADNKHVWPNNTGCYADGRVFMVGWTYRVYALDAATGKLLWHASLGPAAEAREKLKQESLAKGVMLPVKDGAPTFLLPAGDVVVADGMLGKIIAFDAATGAVRWTAGGSRPTRWESPAGTRIVIHVKGSDYALLDPNSGAATPFTAEPPLHEGWIPISGNILLCGTPTVKKNDPRHLSAFQLTPGGTATKLWQSRQLAPGGSQMVVFAPGNVIVKSREQPNAKGREGLLTALDLETGREIASTPFAFVSANGGLGVGDRAFVNADSNHACFPLTMFEPGTLTRLGQPVWQGPHLYTSGYDIPMAHPFVDGRLFFRGMNFIVAYDLRAKP